MGEPMNVRVFEAFAGYGSQAMALRRLAEDYPRFSFEAVGISEIDRYALQAYRAVHGDVPNYGDICKIDWDNVPDFDLLTYSFPCFVADTLILTDKGYKNIQDITCEDKVLTHKNRFCKVATPMERMYNGQLYDIGTMTSGHIQCTENHPFLIRRRYYRYCPDRTRMFRHPEWVKAKYLDKSCYLGYAINQIEEFPKWKGVTDNRWGHGRISDRLSTLFRNRWFWYVMGRYVGDGWKKNSATGSGIIICCLGDILEEDVDARYFLSQRMVDYIFSDSPSGYKGSDIADTGKPSCTVMANWYKTPRQAVFIRDTVSCAFVSYTRDAKGKVKGRHFKNIANTVHTSTEQGGNTDGYIACTLRGRGCDNRQRLEMGGTVSNAITTVAKDALVAENPIGIRKLTERECFRLMDVLETDIDRIQAAGISRTQQYKMAGNSIVVSVLYHIFRKMFVETQCETRQLKLF